MYHCMAPMLHKIKAIFFFDYIKVVLNVNKQIVCAQVQCSESELHSCKIMTALTTTRTLYTMQVHLSLYNSKN